jgi:hemerythrin-like domain-containing protein
VSEREVSGHAVDEVGLTDDDLRLFLLMHRAIRRDLAALPRAAATLDARDTRRIEAVQRWLSFIARTIEHHHQTEDDWVYVRLSERDGSFAAEREALERDHRALDPALREARDRLDALPTSTRFALDRDALVVKLRALETHMSEHLDVEEAAIMPRMKALLSRRELGELEREGARHAKLADVAMVLPWVLSHARPDEVALVEAVLPWPVRLLHRWSWRARYARLSAVIHPGSAPDGTAPAKEAA